MKTTTKWAVGITVLWLVGVAVLVYLKRATFGELGLNEWGDFLAGTVASPLALIWLVAAYRQQGEDLQLNTDSAFAAAGIERAGEGYVVGGCVF